MKLADLTLALAMLAATAAAACPQTSRRTYQVGSTTYTKCSHR